MTIEGIFRSLFPRAFIRMLDDIKGTFQDALDEDKKQNKELWKNEGYAKGHKEGREIGIKEGYEKGLATAKSEFMKEGRTYVSFGDELMFPMDFTDYNSDEEREAIAAIVRTQEWQRCLRHNMLCQAMKKWRDARTQTDPKMMAIFNIVGNQFAELVDFYDNAPNVQQEADPASNFNSLLEDE